MEFATWAYPWDLREEGVSNVAERLNEIGIDEVNLATNYHTVQAFTPHNPERRTFFARASSYFAPSETYDRLKPVPYEGMDGDWVSDIADGFSGTDMSLSSWTIGCHNSRLGMKYPDTTIENAHGDNLVFGLCPSNPDVQAYLRSLITDLANRESFRRIELETFDYFYGTGFGWHHQKIHAELGTLGEFLYGLCFCEDCRANASAASVPVEDVRETVAQTIDDIVAGRIPPDLSPERWVRSHPDVADYLEVREETLVDLYAELDKASGSTPLGYYVGMPEAGREWLVGTDLTNIAQYVDYYTLPAYESSREMVIEAYRTVDQLAPDVPLHVGLLPGHPAIHDGETLNDIIQGLQSEGVPRISFYNYSLLPERSLNWIAAAIEE